MLSGMWNRIHPWFVPSRRNDFHPHLLAERGLLILFAVILGAEGFLVSNVVSSEAGAPPLAAVGAVANSNMPSPALAKVSGYWLRYVIEPLTQISALPSTGKNAFLVLVFAAAALMGLMALTLSIRRRQYQTVGYMAGGMMLLFGATLIFFDTYVFLPGVVASRQTAAVEQSVAQPIVQVHPTLPFTD